MKKHYVFPFLMLFFVLGIQAQNKKVTAADAAMKVRLFESNKKSLVNYSRKEFDKLFFEFFKMKSDPSLVLTKEEFYSYTMKIAAFSDRYAKLYPQEKDVAMASKNEWFDQSYEDYLLSKQLQKQ